MEKKKKDIDKNIIEEEDTFKLIKQKLVDHNYFFVNFYHKLKVDKLYLISFLITLVFFGIIGTIKVKEADGYYDKKNASAKVDASSTDTTLTPAEEAKDDKVDVTDYVGIYSKEYILDNVINFGENCSVDSYKYIYQITSDGKITKYFQNSCIGTIKIWSDEFKYNNTNGARYIGTSKMNFTFGTNKIKEVDGETFKTDTDISTITESKNIEELDITFYGASTVIMTNTNLLLLSKDKVSSPIDDKYTNNGGNLTKRFYKSSTEYQYNFIVFNHTVEDICNVDNKEIADDEIIYKTYSIRYDASSDNFLDAKEIVSRTKSDSCKNYKKDLANLKE